MTEQQRRQRRTYHVSVRVTPEEQGWLEATAKSWARNIGLRRSLSDVIRALIARARHESGYDPRH